MDNINPTNTEYGKNTKYEAREFEMRQILEERYRPKLKLGNGVTPSMITDSLRFIMKHKGADFWSMTSDELATAVNVMTSCCYLTCA